MNAAIITILSAGVLVVGLMIIYFPLAWPQFNVQIFIPYILWGIALSVFFAILQKQRGSSILNNL